MILLAGLLILGFSQKVILSAAGLVLVVSLYVSKKNLWLVVSFIFLVIFQSLIFIFWNDSKYLTGINIILLAAIILAFQRRRFGSMVHSELIEMFDYDLTRQPAITIENLRDLPPIVRNWLIRSNVIGKPPIQTLCIKQKGVMRSKPDGKWLPLRAEQFINTENQGFIWNAVVNAGSIFPIHARDKYFHGHGNMLIKALYTVPIANSSGPEIDQGTLMRFLAEIIWFPTAALAKNIRWECLTETTARATIENSVTSVSGIFRFNSNGDIIGFEGMRYRDDNNHYALAKWTIIVKGYRVFGSFRIANKCEVAWHLESGEFTWLKIELINMKFSYGRQTAQSLEENRRKGSTIQRAKLGTEIKI